MKTAVYVLLALLAGLVLGSLPIKADLRSARNEIADLKKKLSARDSGQNSLGGITSMLKIQEKTGPVPRSRRHSARATTAVEPSASGAVVTVAADVPSQTSAPPHAFQHRHDSTNLLQTLETASALWKTRADLARDSFNSNVGTTGDQAAQFEVTMAAMNLRLGNSIRTWVDYVKQEKDVSPETGIRIMNDLSSTLVLAYNDLDRAMPVDWRKKAGPKFQVFDFINPDVAMPLTEVEDVFKAANHGPPERRRGDDPEEPSDVTIQFP